MIAPFILPFILLFIFSYEIMLIVGGEKIASTPKLYFHKVYLQMGKNLGEHVMSRIHDHISSTNAIVIRINSNKNVTNPDGNSLILSLGNASISKEMINESDLSSMPYESYRVVSRILERNITFLSCNGRPLDKNTHKNISFNKEVVHYGAVVCAYDVLERLGFAFLHPLAPYSPSYLSLDYTEINLSENPYWPSRGFHIHTQHPLELTEVMQGMDIPMFGPHGPDCNKHKYSEYDHQHQHTQQGNTNAQHSNGKSSSSYCERWEDMVDDVNRLFEWCVANKLNAIEWLLLGSFKWGDFDTSDTRMKRLKILTDLGHDYSLLVGADTPIGNIQQHAWHMVNTRLTFEIQITQIQKRVDWVFSSGFDFLTTESGLSEFTHPECDLMLDLLNTFAIYVNRTWGREAAVKVHCSTGQTCEQYSDPRTGEPVNFNFLPMFAVPELGVLPHTVQMYGLTDPTAGAYGNANFGYMEEYMFLEAEKANRTVLYYGETAYWVNVDIDVPLFLPLYGHRRLSDLQRIARRQEATGFHIHGQMNFDSGWEWGYWLNDVITARASWSPFLVAPPLFATCEDPTNSNSNGNSNNNQDSKPNNVDDENWEEFLASLTPLTKIFQTSIGRRLEQLLLKLTKAEADLLLFGAVNGQPCPNIAKLTGIAYMSGVDTWVDLPRMLGLPLTQPDKIHMGESEDPDWRHVAPLLRAMETTFGEIAEEMKQLLSDANQIREVRGPNGQSPVDAWEPPIQPGNKRHNDAAMDILSEFDDCIAMLALRASQIRMLYESSDSSTTPSNKALLQTKSRTLLATAAAVVRRREAAYRVPWQRVAAWRDNPTVYRFGYLWSVHSLYYWWRDQGLAEQGSLQSERSPCYLNRMDASEVAVGWGKYTLELFRDAVNRYVPFLSGYSALEFLNCIAPPEKEYLFPQDLYHY